MSRLRWLLAISLMVVPIGTAALPAKGQAFDKRCWWIAHAKATMLDTAWVTATGPGNGTTATETRAEGTYDSLGFNPNCWGWVGEMAIVNSADRSYCYAQWFSNEAHLWVPEDANAKNACKYAIPNNGPDLVWLNVDGSYCWAETFQPHRHGCYRLVAQVADFYWNQPIFGCYVPAGGYIHPDYELHCEGRRQFMGALSASLGASTLNGLNLLRRCLLLPVTAVRTCAKPS